jgi:hypothetical protein
VIICKKKDNEIFAEMIVVIVVVEVSVDVLKIYDYSKESEEKLLNFIRFRDVSKESILKSSLSLSHHRFEVDPLWKSERTFYTLYNISN